MSRVCVVLPCHDAARHLPRCLDSLAAQVYRSFEVLAVDDGSTDATAEVLSAYARRDPRIRVLHHTANVGLIRSLNGAITQAGTDFVARLDADDEAAPLRLQKQVECLDAHPDVDVVSASVTLIDDRGRWVGRRQVRVTRPAACKFMTAFASPLVHPCVTARTAVLQQFPYSLDAEATHTEDYELWARLSREGRRLANQPERLLRYRLLPRSVSRRHEAVQVSNFLSCAQEHLREGWGRDVPRAILEVLTNRIDFQRECVPLEEGLSLLRDLRDEALARPDTTVGDRREIRQASLMQGLDILLQCILKGSVSLRLRAVRRILPDVLGAASNAPVGRYLLAKVVERLCRRVRGIP